MRLLLVNPNTTRSMTAAIDRTHTCWRASANPVLRRQGPCSTSRCWASIRFTKSGHATRAVARYATTGELKSIGCSGEAVLQACRRVDPPVTVLVDLAALVPHEPHRAAVTTRSDSACNGLVCGDAPFRRATGAGRLVAVWSLESVWCAASPCSLAALNPTLAHLTRRRTQPPGDRSSRWWREVRGW